MTAAASDSGANDSGPNCKTCRFWLAVSDGADCEIDGPAFGWCRREPPKIVEHMARMAIQKPGFSGRNYDVDDVAPVSIVSDASMFPATYFTEWCGQFDMRPAKEGC